MLKAILDAIPDLICAKDATLRFTACNAAFEAFAGRPIADVLGHTCEAFFTDPWADKARLAENEVLRTGQALRGEDWVVYPDGRRVLLDFLFAPVNQNGAVAGLVIIGRDVTDRRKLEEQLRQSQKLEAVGQLAGGVAHDFNNLLTVIISNLELAREIPSAGLLQTAERAARRAAELTGQLLGFARRQPLRSEPVDLNEHLHEAFTLLRRTIDPRITIEVVPSPQPAVILGDPGQINQVLLNLCLNARDAMPAGGILTLSAAHDGDTVVVAIHDTGTGMPPDVLAHIFEPFYTTKGIGKGTGLGLAMVFGIVESHGGKLECESAVGQGTTFEMRFPAHAGVPAAKAGELTPIPEAQRRARILLADDEPMIRQLARLILEPLGHSVALAVDGLDAVKQFREGTFDIVILDLTMPNLAGRDALQAIREIAPTVPVLLTSGYSRDRATIGESANGFLEKPFTPTDLAAAIQKVLI